MNFAPKTEEELNANNIFKKGIYDFEVYRAVDKISKSGNEMIELELKVFASDGEQTHVFDYLLEAMGYKLKHFCEATGLSDIYQSGNLTADMCSGRAAKCTLEIEPKTSNYAEKNKVKDYHPADMATAPPSEDADCPF